MSVSLVITIILVSLTALWFWGRQPIVFRAIRPGGLLEHCDALIRSGDGTLMFIKDESKVYRVEVDKYFISRDEIEVTVLVRDHEKGGGGICSAFSNCRHFHRLVRGSSEKKFALVFRIDRDPQTAVQQLFQLLSKSLETLNNSVNRSYEICYKVKSIGREVDRSKYEKRVNQTGMSEWKRRHALEFLSALDKQLEQRVARKNAELDIRLQDE
jgi:hypothetical protein